MRLERSGSESGGDDDYVFMALGTSFGTACDYSQIREGRLEEPFQPLGKLIPVIYS